MRMVIKTADWLLIAAILAATLLGGIAQWCVGTGDSVVVTLNGETVAQYPLHTARDVTLTGYGGGKNRLVIENGTARIESADCNDALCAAHSPISQVGDSILCLPHRLAVTVVSTGTSPDAVVS